MPRPERTPEARAGVSARPRPSPPGPEALRLLSGGTIELLGLMPRASNYTFLAEVKGGGEAALAVYKPRDGEAPLWDFPDGTLYRREVAAFELATALGWPSVPPTVEREGPHGPGSLQLFVDVEPGQHYFTLREERPDDFPPVAAFDAVANNADRKSGHCLMGRDGLVWMIDHGVCFNVAPKLRSVIWEFADEPIPEPLREDLRRIASALRSGALAERMGELLSFDEVEAAARRAEALVQAGCFPSPGDDRAFPWPPV
jgi:hypothetical protein